MGNRMFSVPDAVLSLRAENDIFLKSEVFFR